MKRYKLPFKLGFYLIIIFLALNASAQGLKISGRIIDSANHEAVPNVTVYIGNSSISTAANKDGRYTLNNLMPGSYTLVTSCIGYAPEQVQVSLTKDEVVNINLNIQATELAEVNIKSNNYWGRNLGLFTTYFIGNSEYSSLCKIINEKALRLNFENRILSASTTDFLIIENKALGYRIKFLINNYTVDIAKRVFHYNGIAIFEDLQGSEKQKKNWAKLRQNVFKASFNGFLHSLARSKVTQDGFIVRRFLRYDNPDRPADSVLQKSIERLMTMKPSKAVTDSLANLSYTRALPKKIEQVIGKVLTAADLTKPSKEAGLTDLVFEDYIYVIYKKKRINFRDNLYRTREASDNQLSIIENKNIADPVQFNADGLKITKGALFFDGAWGDPSVSYMLPNNYLPDN
ncbi:carboxypeptidase-like regulatory domain-containing protein [Mucilaginibacter calamicampi]|uniref:Carboxypeptidase-like regulatory domain-containing protein n=1 Tax=Mucilaginibacter calamicampi TaxID=1302352 RepID=A0ABW2YZY7_9SPHI